MTPNGVEFLIPIKSGKYGNSNNYIFHLEKDFMRIERSDSFSVTCVWQEGSQPIWQNTHVSEYSTLHVKEPLIDMLNHEQIYPPNQFVSAIERAWFAWRKNELSNEQVKVEIKLLCDWLDKITDSKPISDFWKGVF